MGKSHRLATHRTRRLKNFFWISLIAFLLFRISVDASVPVTLKVGENWVTKEAISYYEGDLKSPARVIYGEVDSLFHAAGKVRRSQQLTGLWIKFELQNATTEGQHWVLDLGHWAYADLYELSHGNSASPSGRLIPYGLREHKRGNRVVFRSYLPPGGSKKYYLKLKDAFSGEVQVKGWDFRVFDQGTDDDRHFGNMQFSVLFLGILVMMFLYNSFLFLNTRQQKLRFYLLTLFFLILGSLVTPGFIVSMFPYWHGAPVINAWISALWQYPVMICSLFFMEEFLEVRKRYPFWSKVVRFQAVLVGIFMLIACKTPELGSFLFAVDSLLLIPMYLIIAIRSVKDRYPSSTYFLVGQSIWIAGGIYTMLVSIYVLEGGPFSRQVFPLANCLEMVLFSLALGNQINVLKREVNLKQAQIIKTLRKEAKTTERIRFAVSEAQEQQRTNFANRLHDDLQNLLVAIHYAILGWKGKASKDEEEFQKRETKLIELTQLSIEKTREIAHEMMPKGLSTSQSFVETIQELLSHYEGVTIEFDAIKEGERELPMVVKGLAFRVIKELVTNSIKHGAPDLIKIELRYGGKMVEVVVEDDGIGMTPDKIKDPGMGLKNLSLQVNGIGGAFEMESSSGLTSRVILPVQEPQ